MRDYDELDELVVNLRNCAKVNSLSLYKRDLMKQAADAIEKLQQNIEQYKLYLQDAINDLHSAHEKEQKHGEWIRLSKDLAQCSECKDYIDNAVSCGYNFCPNCGARMEETE